MSRRVRTVGRELEGTIEVCEENEGNARAEAIRAEAILVEARNKYREGRTRSCIALIIVSLSASLLLGASVLGLYKGSFEALQTLWNAQGFLVGGIVGGIITYYFKKAPGDDGS